MAILGTIIGLIICAISFFLLGPYGILISVSLIFGLVFSTYLKTQDIQNELKKIKDKLGIVEIKDTNLTDEEIEEELLRDISTDELTNNRKYKNLNTPED